MIIPITFADWQNQPLNLAQIDGQISRLTKWADFSFHAEDRTFYVFEIGTSMLSRLEANDSFLSPEDRKFIEKQAGCISTAGPESCWQTDPTMWYTDSDELIKAWVYLHDSFKAPFSDEEKDAFGLWPIDDGDL